MQNVSCRPHHPLAAETALFAFSISPPASRRASDASDVVSQGHASSRTFLGLCLMVLITHIMYTVL